MDVNTGHLVRDINRLPEEVRHRYTRVPDALAERANELLADAVETTVNLRRREELTRWAANVRKKNRARAKVQKASRKKNHKR